MLYHVECFDFVYFYFTTIEQLVFSMSCLLTILIDYLCLLFDSIFVYSGAATSVPLAGPISVSGDYEGEEELFTAKYCFIVIS